MEARARDRAEGESWKTRLGGAGKAGSSGELNQGKEVRLAIHVKPSKPPPIHSFRTQHVTTTRLTTNWQGVDE